MPPAVLASPRRSATTFCWPGPTPSRSATTPGTSARRSSSSSASRGSCARPTIRPARRGAARPCSRTAPARATRPGARVLVVNVMGRLFMDPLDDPFAAVDRELDACPLGQAADAIVVDVHAEATSEKQALAAHCDGRASLVVGTHTHAPTIDHRILPGGTAFQSDAGMCGDYDSILGMKKDEAVRRFIHKTPGSRLEAAGGEGTLCGLAVETDDRTGLALRVAAVRLGPNLEESWPRFWD